MSSAIYPDPPKTRTAVCGHGEQQRLSNARLRLTFYNAPVAYRGPVRPGSAFQQSAVSGLLPRARARVGRFRANLDRELSLEAMWHAYRASNSAHHGRVPVRYEQGD